MIPKAILKIIKESVDNLYEESYQDYRNNLENARNYPSSYGQERISVVKQYLENIFEISQLLMPFQNKNHKEEAS